ncbi:MAG: multidrug transporter [Thermodesulfobacteriota bacterium]|nr:multidrug transporter [Thermodesulfobacteriota bacterium]
MHKIVKQSTAFFLIAALLFVPFSSSAVASVDFEKKDPSAGAMVADFVLVRPVAIIALVVGSAFFVVTLPFSAIGGNVKAAAKSMVVKPAKYSFIRPLGEF